MKKMNLKEFEFSQAHIHFWDKFERSNHFLETMIETSDRPYDDRTIHFLLSDPIGDGGQWNMAMNLVRKHGLVPKSAYPESFSSGNTRWMNIILKDILQSGGRKIGLKLMIITIVFLFKTMIRAVLLNLTMLYHALIFQRIKIFSMKFQL